VTVKSEANAIVPPFGVPASALPVLNRPLAAAVAAEIAESGLDPSTITIAPDVYVNAACLRALAEKRGRLRLRAAGWARMAGGPDVRDVEVAVGAGGDAVEIDAQEMTIDFAQGPETVSFAAPRRIACRIASWSDLLWANLFAMSARMRNIPPATGVGLVALAALRARSLNPWSIAGKLVKTGRRCDVHPRAIVEASVLGDGVRIGPGAVVRNSHIGDGVEVEELAFVSGSVLGHRSRVQRQAMFKFSVLDEGAIAGGTIQLSFFGAGSALRGGSYTLDRRLDGRPVQVMSASGLVEAGPTIGAALGPKASVGSGVWIAPGRAIPAGAIVVRGEQDMVAKIPAGLPPGVYAVRDGTLVRQ
jgi:hypothetical protein